MLHHAGQGLGKSGDGVVEPLRVPLKRDKAGVRKKFAVYMLYTLFCRLLKLKHLNNDYMHCVVLARCK